MLKIFNGISIFGGLIGGYICSLLGGWDVILKALVILVIFDYVTGLFKGNSDKDVIEFGRI